MGASLGKHQAPLTLDTVTSWLVASPDHNNLGTSFIRTPRVGGEWPSWLLEKIKRQEEIHLIPVLTPVAMRS